MKFPGRWYPDSKKYRDECLKISKDLDNFKMNPIYQRHIASDIMRYDDAKKIYIEVKDMEYCHKNDIYGNPKIHKINNVFVSGGTLMFMKVKKDISIFEYKSVVEIGSGYGGQCLVTGCNDYTLVDIPESLEIAKAYLKVNKIKAKFMSTNNIESIVADLCISNFALGELNSPGIEFYLNMIIKDCKYIYFTVNKTSTKRIISLFDNYFRLEINNKTYKKNDIITGSRS